MGEVIYLDGRGEALKILDAMRKQVESGKITHLSLSGWGSDEDRNVIIFAHNVIPGFWGLAPLIGVLDMTRQVLISGMAHQVAHHGGSGDGGGPKGA